MAKKRILYVCQEITPYVAETEESLLCRRLPQAMQETGNEIRTFMPRFGCINERRNQLHEVIRLSGMNIIINDNDHQLIIKVASIPSARIQIYFIDNEDFFTRKATFSDQHGKFFADNDERMIFFSLGALETVKKLRWIPDVVHCNGWFSAIVPVMLKHLYANDPDFCKVKVVVSLFDDKFPGSLDKNLAQKLRNEGIEDENLSSISDPTYENLFKYVISKVDGVVASSQNADKDLLAYAKSCGKKVLDYVAPTDDNADAVYDSFYEDLLK